MEYLSWIFLALMPVFHFTSGAVLQIGAVVESHRVGELSAVKYAVAFANANILTGNSLNLTVLTSDQNKTLESVHQSCKLLNSGIAAQIGPGSSAHVLEIAPVFDQLNVPLMVPTAGAPGLGSFNFLAKLNPSDNHQGKALAGLFTKMVWRSFHILTSDEIHRVTGGLIAVASQNNWHIVSMQTFDASSPTPDVTTQLQQIKHSGYRVTVINCATNQAHFIIDKAREAGMTGQGWIYILTDGTYEGIQVIPSTNSSEYLIGLIGTGPPIKDGSLASQFETGWLALDPALYPGAAKPLIASVSLWADAVFSIAYAVQNGNSLPTVSPLSCTQSTTWTDGANFFDQILNVTGAGVSRDIRFDPNGYPSSPKTTCVLYNSQMNGWKRVATWNPITSYQPEVSEHMILPGNVRAAPDFISAINGKHFRIVTFDEEPFWFFPHHMPPKDPMNIDLKNGEMIGFGVDLTLEVAKILNFTYSFYVVPDGTYGGKNVTSNSWNGVVGELIDNKADFAFATFTANSNRETVVDITASWLDIGLQFLMPKEDKRQSAFAFLKPMHTSFWTMLILLMVMVAIMVSMLEKISPYGRQGEFIFQPNDMARINALNRRRKPFRRHAKETREFMRIDNAIWFSLAALIQQGYDSFPTALSSRIITLLWFAVILFTTSMYTARLGSQLIVSRMQTAINSVEELYMQDQVYYGCTRNTAAHMFFCGAHNKFGDHKLMHMICMRMAMWGSFVTGTAEATAKLADPNDNFAYVTDSPIADALMEKKPCNLRRMGEVFNKGGFGFGLPKDSPYTHILSQTILQLKQNSFMDDLRYTWFTARSECVAENREKSTIEKYQQTFDDVRGIFYVIIVAVCISPILLLIEFSYSCHTYRIREEGYLNKQISVASVVVFRLRRMGNDFLVYTVPEWVKSGTYLEDYTRKRQHEVWEEKSAKRKLAVEQKNKRERQRVLEALGEEEYDKVPIRKVEI